jgi:hypothetical protein
VCVCGREERLFSRQPRKKKSDEKMFVVEENYLVKRFSENEMIVYGTFGLA